MNQLSLIAAPAPAGAARPAPIERRLHVAGIDVSLTGTGVATTTGTTTIRTTGKRADSLAVRHRRLQLITRRLFDEIGECDLAVLESASYGSIGGSSWDRAGLWWLIVDGLLDREIAVAMVPPSCRAKYATGKGNAGKAAVMRAAQQTYGVLTEDDNQSDAVHLRAMGHDWAGQPLAAVPEINRTALLSCQWPDLAELKS